MAGLIYGDRKLSIVKQSYFIDEGNRLFCEIKWGKNKSAGNEFGKFHDYFEGEVMKMK